MSFSVRLATRMMSLSSILVLTFSHAPVLAASETWTLPLPDLNKIEECQRADLSRSYGKTFRFHLYECWADVAIDSNGKVTAFKPDNAEICEQVLSKC